jgi:hypothetical protein
MPRSTQGKEDEAGRAHEDRQQLHARDWQEVEDPSLPVWWSHLQGQAALWVLAESLCTFHPSL